MKSKKHMIIAKAQIGYLPLIQMLLSPFHRYRNGLTYSLATHRKETLKPSFLKIYGISPKTFVLQPEPVTTGTVISAARLAPESD